jgi:acyl transferase domain-containing protein
LAFVYGAREVLWGGAGMWNTLAAETGPVADALQRCAHIIEARMGWSLEQTLSQGVEHIAQERIDAAIAAVQIALTEGWRRRGFAPDAVCGRSSGEAGAEFGAGALTLENALEAPMRWGRLVQERGGESTMLMVRATLSQTAALQRASPVEFFVIADGTEDITVIGCTRARLAQVSAYLNGQRARHAATGFVTAPHSPLVEAWKPRYTEPPVASLPPRATYYSAGSPGPDAGTAYAERMWRAVRAPVLMGATLTRMMENGIEVFIEVGGRTTLDDRIHARAAALGKRAVVLPTMRLRQAVSAVMDETQQALARLGIAPRTA